MPATAPFNGARSGFRKTVPNSQPIRWISQQDHFLHDPSRNLNHEKPLACCCRSFRPRGVAGALWLAFQYFLPAEGDFGPEVHPLEAWWLRLHGLMAMAALVLGGTLVPNHMRLVWNRRRHMSSGAPMLTLWLASSGYALYYLPTDDNAAWLPQLHWIAGLALPVILVMHIRIGRRRVPRTARRAHHSPQLHVIAQPYAPKQASS